MVELSDRDLVRWFNTASALLCRKTPEPSADPGGELTLTSRERTGLKSSIYDLIFASHHTSQTHLSDCDEKLRGLGLPSFNEMVGVLRRKERSILRRGVIRDTAEYYIVREIVNDAAPEFSAKQIARFGEMMGEYERVSPSD